MTSATTTESTREVRFVRAVAGWAEHRRGDLAALRRSLARPPGTDPAALRLVLPLLAGINEPEQWRFFLVAGLVALDPKAHAHDDGGVDFGTSCRSLGVGANGGAVERRFVRLLDAEGDGLTHHLRQVVRLLASRGVRWDAARLLQDLRSWDHPDRFVQRRWARSFWAPSPEHQWPSSENENEVAVPSTAEASLG